MRLYNALTRQKESFENLGNSVSLYVCGITPYDTTHIGHGFTYASFDILIRYLEYLGFQVQYAQNVTDIDDDILRRAKKDGDDWWDLGNRWTVHFIDDNMDLNLRAPDYFPRATDVIDEIITAVQALLDVGVAYVEAGNVYFHIAADPDYGKLSQLSLVEMLPIANERGNNPGDSLKKAPLDFVLWQAQSPGEPAWDSPWGPGRPGWHIECSTMSAKYLGQPIDIHGGGADLIFPHHESEIAQAECATGQDPFSRFWMHIAMVYYQSEKMSKSLGNLVMIRDLLEEGRPADAIRLYLANHHYRDEWSYEEAELDAAVLLAAKFKETVMLVGGSDDKVDPAVAEAAFGTAMDDDLDTPTAVNALEQMADTILAAAKKGQNIEAAQGSFRLRCGILGLRLDQAGPEERVTAGWQKHRQRFSLSE